jgi:N utilization substance protein A
MINGPEALRILDSIARDRGVDRETLIVDIEQAMVSAARKHFNTLDAEEFTCTFDRMTGEMTLLRHGEKLDLAPETLGRIAAQTFKQVMIQKFREDERASIYDVYSKRVGDIITATVQRYERGTLQCYLAREQEEAFMPASEQIPGEQFHPGDRIRCLILDVRDMGNKVKIVLSRAHADFIKRLLEVEVPEVAERVIEIKALAREAGYRTKLAVSSIDSKVDAVGACVGVRGTRIKNIVEELSGEKIDVVRWNESSSVLIQNALKPAEVEEVSLCFELGRATVVVRDDQLSLAIGKRGQNVRLAARLTGWDVDILTPDEFNKSLEIMAETLRSVEGITEEQLDRIAALGMISVFDIEEVGVEVLMEELEMPQEVAERAVEIAAARAKTVAEEQAREKEAQKQARGGDSEEARADLILGSDQEGGAPVDQEAEAAADDILGLGPASGAEPQAAEEAIEQASEQRAEG